uniref:Ig-like domain-containing protein n=1 Tax=Anopheles gambiae TaxID=7165 RepID=A0A453YZV0_ANOGA
MVQQLCKTVLILVNLSVALSIAKASLIHISGPRIAVQYSKIQLRCMASTGQKHFLWYFSSNGSAAAQYPKEPLSSHPFSAIRFDTHGAMLTIRAVDRTHVGSYRCCATDTLCATMSLFVVSATDDPSELRPTDSLGGGVAVLDVQSDGTFELAIFHAPLLEGEISLEREAGAVRFCDHFRHRAEECNEQRTNGVVAYIVRNATMEASAQFQVKITNNKRLEVMHLHILIRGKPIVRMDTYCVLRNLSHINLSCQGYAYPTPNVTFTYTPCLPTAMDRLSDIQRDACEKSITVPQHLERLSPFNHTTIFEVIIPSWPVLKPGIVSCRASNGEGSSSIETLLFVRNFHEPMQFRIESPTDVVLYDDTVNITCQADVYNFTNQLTIHHGGSSFHLAGEQLGYAWTITYLAHITNDSQNEVVCEGHHKNGTRVRSTLNLSIQYPSKPHVVSVNDSVNVTIADGDAVRLECDIDGTPSPDIVWFKNDAHLRHAQGHFVRVALDEDETRATYRCVGRSRLGRATKTWYIVVEESMHWLLIGGLGAGALIALLVIGTVAWSVGAYQQLLHRQMDLETQLRMSKENVADELMTVPLSQRNYNTPGMGSSLVHEA